MTISYNYDVQSASVFSFFRLLFRWKASIWKIVLTELLVWTFAYLIVSFFYRSSFFLTKEQKITFEETANYFQTYLKRINITFILGFFASNVVTRWTSILKSMGYIESFALFVSSYIRGDDENTRMLRRAIVRYACVSQVQVFRDISVRVRKRFPTIDSLVDTGFLLDFEKEKLESIDLQYDKYWVPINWATSLIFIARRDGRITGDILVNKLMDEMKVFRTNLQMLCIYDWVPLPLVYPQVINIAVYFYFAICLFSRQFIMTDRNAPNKDRIDLIMPLMTMIEFIFLVGWMKVALCLMNPFGDDDDDFECNFLINKNLATSLCIVDKCCNDVPEIEEDQFRKGGITGPMYPRGSIIAEHPLVGSATKAGIEENKEDTKMTQRNRSQAGSRRRSSLFFPFRRTTVHDIGETIRGHARSASSSILVSTGKAKYDRTTSCPDNRRASEVPSDGSDGVTLRGGHSRRCSIIPSWILSTLIEEDQGTEQSNSQLGAAFRENRNNQSLARTQSDENPAALHI